MAQDIIINQNPHQQVFQSLTAKSLKRNYIEVLLLVMSSQAVISKNKKFPNLLLTPSIRRGTKNTAHF